jgi:hypothetical protein
MTTANGRTRAERAAEALGVIVGAASRCESVNMDRLVSTSKKAREVLETAAGESADAVAVNDRFTAGLDIGQAAVDYGKIDPQEAEKALEDLEQTLSE